jgi:hypothetical protein
MTNKQESYEKMSVATASYLLANATITAGLPSFSTYFTVVVATNGQIQIFATQQETDTSGNTKNKKLLRTTLIAQAIDVDRRTVAFATNVNNNVLLSQVNYTESDLNKSSDTKLVGICQVIRDSANANVAALATYGITAAVLTTLQTSITNFNNAIPKVRVGTTDSGEATQQLKLAFITLASNWAKIDTLVEMVRSTQPAFYDEYQTVRKVIDTSGTTLSVKGLVTDALSGEPVKGVTVSFALDGGMMLAKASKASSSTAVVTKKSAEKGGIQVKSMAAGTYQVTLKKAGYADQVVTASVNDGEMTVLNVSISKN